MERYSQHVSRGTKISKTMRCHHTSTKNDHQKLEHWTPNADKDMKHEELWFYCCCGMENDTVIFEDSLVIAYKN